ncbi:MAG: alpha/beta hydrolase [Burkholderiales bacterium]|nr:alpha/beta hydrolase [Burkholderiales bacterium]
MTLDPQQGPRLDPQAAAVLERAARANLPPYAGLGAAAARALYRETRAQLAPAPPEVERVEDLQAAGPAGAIPVRLYRALGAAPEERLPALVYFHGGGWTIGDLDTHDVVCRELANLARCAVVSVAYRLAPEHKFPAAVEDALAATRWVARMADALGLDAARLAVGGDSAGGNLAAVAAIALRDAGGPPLVAQVLIYPATDLAADAPSHFEFAEGHMLTRESIGWFTGNYLRDPADAADWRASPLRAPDLARLPPAYVATAGFDPLRDEGRAYADRLHAAGVSVTYECFEGMIHGFVTMGGVIAAAHHALYRAATVLRQAFLK